MKIYELTVDDNTDEVYAISLVENPAIEMDFMAFNKHKETIQFASINNEQRKLIGPILIPEKKILRIDDSDNSTYQVFFSKETVAKLAQNYLAKKYVDKSTLEHDKKVKGINLVESWIKTGKFDKSNNYGFNVPDGSWMGIFQIDHSPEGDKLWNDYIKTGKVKGFSVEALLSHKLVKASMDEILNKKIEELSEKEAEVILSHIKAKILKDNRYKAGKRIEMESYSDYGEAIRNNAKKGIELNEKNGNKCATQTGKIRAQQIAKGEPLSIETIKRIHSYLSRAETYYDNAESNSDCGYISYLLWGGKAALGWSRNKLRELGLLTEAEGEPSIPNSSYPGQAATKIVSPAMIGQKKKIKKKLFK